MPPRTCNLAELCIDIGEGQAIVKKDGNIEFEDCLPVSVKELEYVLREATNYISYRNERLSQKLIDEFPEFETKHMPRGSTIPSETVESLIDKFPEPELHITSRLANLAAEMESENIVLVSSWGIKCGIATYTGYLFDAISKLDPELPLKVSPVRDNIGGKIIHLQHEYGIMPRPPKSKGKVIITFHTVFKDIQKTMELYEKDLDVVAYVAHFRDAYDIISASTEKDVWQIPHGSKIMPVDRDGIKQHARNLLQLSEDKLYAFMFGFQSDNKNYQMVTRACEKAGINLLISGAVNDNSCYKGNIKCDRDNVTVIGRYLSEVEVDLYALASDILLFNNNPLDHYSCSGALHRVIGAGKPVICNRVNHYVDLFEGEDCLKYDSEDELVEKIKEALERKEELGQKALEYAQRTSWEIVAKKHLKLYEKYGGAESG